MKNLVLKLREDWKHAVEQKNGFEGFRVKGIIDYLSQFPEFIEEWNKHTKK